MKDKDRETSRPKKTQCLDLVCNRDMIEMEIDQILLSQLQTMLEFLSDQQGLQIILVMFSVKIEIQEAIDKEL
jgi:hypothetical protein